MSKYGSYKSGEVVTFSLFVGVIILLCAIYPVYKYWVTPDTSQSRLLIVRSARFYVGFDLVLASLIIIWAFQFAGPYKGEVIAVLVALLFNFGIHMWWLGCAKRFVIERCQQEQGFIE